MILSDRTLRDLLADGRLVIDPTPADHRFQPASIDVTLGGEFITYATWPEVTLDPTSEGGGARLVDVEADWFYLRPGEFALGTTVEHVTVPEFLVARIEGKSSLGRLGLLVHATAGFVDPGFSGRLTLELYNCAPLPIVLTPGMGIAQLSFHRLDQPCERPYGHPALRSRYQGQETVTASRGGRP